MKTVRGTIWLLILAIPAFARAEQIDVSSTYNDEPFSYRMELQSRKLGSRKPGYRIYRLTYPSPVVSPVEQNNTVPADYYLPEGIAPEDAKRPAVICMHILEGNFELVHITCSVLASRGIPAVMFKLPYYGERSMPGGRRALASNPTLFVESLTQAQADVRRTIDVLASRPEVDPRRIGITGISLGGIVAATAAGAEPRLNKAALILAGGHLRHIIDHARETRAVRQTIEKLPPSQRAELEKALQEVDPLQHAAGLRDRARAGKVLMINAAEDEVIPRVCTEKLAAALGISDRVIWLPGLGHYTSLASLPETLRRTADFFGEDLPPEVRNRPPVVPESGPLLTVVTLMRQVGALAVAEPLPGRCHVVDLQIAVRLKDGKEHTGELRLVRGRSPRFSLRCRLPVVGRVAAGQGAYPWMASGEKLVLRGLLDEDDLPKNPLSLIRREDLLKLQMLDGIVAAVTMVPETIEKWITVEEAKSDDGSPIIRIVRNDRKQDHLELKLKEDGRTPRQLVFNVEGVQGTITFHTWQFDTLANDALFEAPAELPIREIDAADLYRMFSAIFSFAAAALR